MILVAAETRDRVRACVSVVGFELPQELSAASGQRSWYKEVSLFHSLTLRFRSADSIRVLAQHSLILLPSTHPLQEDARRTGKTQKKYGAVYRGSEFCIVLA